ETENSAHLSGSAPARPALPSSAGPWPAPRAPGSARTRSPPAPAARRARSGHPSGTAGRPTRPAPCSASGRRSPDPPPLIHLGCTQVPDPGGVQRVSRPRVEPSLGFFGVPSLPPQLAQQLLDPVASPRRLLGQLALQQLNGPRGPLVPGPDPLEEALVVVDHRALLRRLLAPEHSPEPLPGDPPLEATRHLAHVSRSFHSSWRARLVFGAHRSTPGLAALCCSRIRQAASICARFWASSSGCRSGAPAGVPLLGAWRLAPWAWRRAYSSCGFGMGPLPQWPVS